MKKLLLKLAILKPSVNNILLAKKHRLQEELHKAVEMRNFTEAEGIGNELLEVNKALRRY